MNRYRLIYGETHDSVHIKDELLDKKIGTFPVNELNHQYNQIKAMESTLNELGYECWFVRDDDGDFDKRKTKTPKVEDKGQWIVVKVI